MFLEITVLKDFRKFTEKYLKRTETLLKKGFIADVFSVTFVRLFRTVNLQNGSKQLTLVVRTII